MIYFLYHVHELKFLKVLFAIHKVRKKYPEGNKLHLIIFRKTPARMPAKDIRTEVFLMEEINFLFLSKYYKLITTFGFIKSATGTSFITSPPPVFIITFGVLTVSVFLFAGNTPSTNTEHSTYRELVPFAKTKL